MADPFLTLLREAARTLPDDLETGETQDLIGRAATLASWLWVIALLAWENDGTPEAVWVEVVALMKLTVAPQLRRLHAKGASQRVLFDFAGWVIALDRIWTELRRRVPPGPPQALAAFGGMVPAVDHTELLWDLRIERLLDFTSDDPGDLRSIGVVAALEEAAAIRRRGAEALRRWLVSTRIIVPPPTICGCEVELDPPWDRAALQSWTAIDVIASWSPVWATQPALRADRLAQAAHWGALDEIKREHAQKRGGGTEELDIVSVAEASILDLDGGEPERQALQVALEAREEAQRILATLRESLGPKAATYFLEWIAGASQVEAAQAAGVTARMARKYQQAAQRLLGKKK